MRAWVRPAFPAITLAATMLALPAQAQQGGNPGARSGGGASSAAGNANGGAPQAGGSGGLTAAPPPASLGEAPVSGQSDTDTVRDAVASGRSVPYASVLAAVGSVVHGTVVEVDLMGVETGRLSYAIKVLTPEGDLRTVQVDARRGIVEAVR